MVDKPDIERALKALVNVLADHTESESIPDCEGYFLRFIDDRQVRIDWSVAKQARPSKEWRIGFKYHHEEDDE